jgi:hypothetical protein
MMNGDFFSAARARTIASPRPCRTAHEIEILHRDDDAGAFQLAVADLDHDVSARRRAP